MDTLLTLARMPMVQAVLIALLSTVVLDLDAYLAFRKEHPGAAYDWVVFGVKLLKVTLTAVVATLGGTAAANLAQ